MKTDIQEYVEGFPVEILKLEDRFVIQALNEGGNNETIVDLLDVLEWVINNCPELISFVKKKNGN